MARTVVSLQPLLTQVPVSSFTVQVGGVVTVQFPNLCPVAVAPERASVSRQPVLVQVFISSPFAVQVGAVISAQLPKLCPVASAPMRVIVSMQFLLTQTPVSLPFVVQVGVFDSVQFSKLCVTQGPPQAAALIPIAAVMANASNNLTLFLIKTILHKSFELPQGILS